MYDVKPAQDVTLGKVVDGRLRKYCSSRVVLAWRQTPPQFTANYQRPSLPVRLEGPLSKACAGLKERPVGRVFERGLEGSVHALYHTVHLRLVGYPMDACGADETSKIEEKASLNCGI